jgi:hypothetical protein
MAAGEWHEHTLTISTAGYYDLSARVATPHSGKTFRMLIDGADVTGTMAAPNTGAYQNWQTVTRSRVHLTSGTHRLRFVADTSSFNLNWISVTRSQ